MVLRSQTILSFAVSTLVLWLSGCGSPNNPAPPSGDTGQPDQTQSNSAEIVEQLAKLTPEDRAAAEKQKICPVTGEPLGSMGVPPKVSVNDREVFLCCKACEDALKEDPEKHLANLPKP